MLSSSKQEEEEEAIKSSLLNGGRGSGGLKVRREHCAKGTRPQRTVVPFFSLFFFALGVAVT